MDKETTFEDVESGEYTAQELMAYRCKSQGHDYETHYSAFMRVYQRCKWCGKERGT